MTESKEAGNPGLWTRIRIALREAWWTFRLSLLGWEVEGYALRVHRGYGRCAGNLFRWQPTYIGSEPAPHEHGWGLSSEGESWRERWGTPVEAVRADSRPGRVIAKRIVKRRAGSSA